MTEEPERRRRRAIPDIYPWLRSRNDRDLVDRDSEQLGEVMPMDVVTTLLAIAEEQDSVIRKTAIMDAVNAVEKQREYPGRRTFKCPVCGADILLTDVFCRHCGQRLPSSKDMWRAL